MVLNSWGPVYVVFFGLLVTSVFILLRMVPIHYYKKQKYVVIHGNFMTCTLVLSLILT